MSLKKKYAVVESTMDGSHGNYQNKIVSLHKSRKDAHHEAQKSFWHRVLELKDAAQIGDRVNHLGEIQPELKGHK